MMIITSNIEQISSSSYYYALAMIISPFICIWILWFNADSSDDNLHDYIQKLHTDADDGSASQSPENGQMDWAAAAA